MKALGAAVCAVFVLATIFVQTQTLTADAASPTSTTLSPAASAPVTWTGTAIGGSALNAPVAVGSETLCREGLTCDTFTLNVGGTRADWAGKRARVKMEWNLPVTDYDLYIHKGSNTGPIVASSGNGLTSPAGPLTSEETTIDPWASGTGVYTVHAVYYAATTVDQYRGSASVEAKPIPPATPTRSTATPPSYQNFAAPSGLGESAGEPTDATPPVISLASRTPAANGYGWNNTAVTIRWNCEDATSGALSSDAGQTVIGSHESARKGVPSRAAVIHLPLL